MERILGWKGAAPWFGSAVVVLLAAVAAHVARVPLNGTIVLVTVGAVLTVAGYGILEAERQEGERRKRTDLTLERLSRQVESERQTVDALATGLEVAIFVCDRALNVLYANRSARELFRFPDPVGRPLLAVTLSHELVELAREAARDEEARTSELHFQLPDERIGLAKAWPSPEGRLFVSLVEITDLRRLERIRRDFVANVSHELRTPLTVIRAYAETILDDDAPDPELVGRYLPRVIAEVDRLNHLTSDLLVLSAAEAGPVRKNACDLAETLRGVVVQLESKARAKGIDLGLSAPKTMMIEANPGQMVQVGLNLVDNAINYTAAGTVDVALEERPETVVITVRDTGVGISEADQKRVFERFYRADKGRSRQSGGTGLGLAIVKHLVEAHGGVVEIESQLGKGTTMRVELPRGDLAFGEISGATLRPGP